MEITNYGLYRYVFKLALFVNFINFYVLWSIITIKRNWTFIFFAINLFYVIKTKNGFLDLITGRSNTDWKEYEHFFSTQKDWQDTGLEQEPGPG